MWTERVEGEEREGRGEMGRKGRGKEEWKEMKEEGEGMKRWNKDAYSMECNEKLTAFRLYFGIFIRYTDHLARNMTKS